MPPRDHYVRVASNGYSVHSSAVGRRVEVLADLETVTVTCAGRPVAGHDRCWASGQTLTDPQHAAAAAVLRAEHRRASVSPRPADTDVAVRPLADYDAAFGLTDTPQAVA